MKHSFKLPFLFIVTALCLCATVWWASGDRLLHYANKRVLNQSAITAIRTVGPISAGFELTQRIDTTQLNDSHVSLHELPLCIHVFLDATDGHYSPGTLQFELISKGLIALATLESSQIPHTFQRICFPNSSMNMLIGASDTSLRISVVEPDVKNVARLVLTPRIGEHKAADINGQSSDLFLPHMIEVRLPVNGAAASALVTMVALTTAAIFIIFLVSGSARREPGLHRATDSTVHPPF